MTHLHVLGKTLNGCETFFSDVSHAAQHFADNPALLRLVVEAIPRVDLRGGNHIELEVDFGRIIGATDGVETDETDVIVYAKRNGHEEYTPFTKSRVAQPSSLLSLSFRRQSDTAYELLSAWIGEAFSPPFPGEPGETHESRPYWSTHALVWGSQTVEPESVTSRCPW